MKEILKDIRSGALPANELFRFFFWLLLPPPILILISALIFLAMAFFKGYMK